LTVRLQFADVVVTLLSNERRPSVKKAAVDKATTVAAIPAPANQDACNSICVWPYQAIFG
jgi:hypothetical protein